MFIAILLFVISILVSFLINGLFLRFSRNLGMRNIENEQIRWASTTKPALGGFSFYIVFLLSIAFYAIISERHSFLNNEQLLGILMSSTLGFFIGLADDAYNTKPILKLTSKGISCQFTTCNSLYPKGNTIKNPNKYMYFTNVNALYLSINFFTKIK